jgi:tRNA modification GTPase
MLVVSKVRPLGPLLVALNKSDLPAQLSRESLLQALQEAAPEAHSPFEIVPTSALTGAGLEELRHEILALAAPARDTTGEGEFITNLRHQQLIKQSLASLEKARAAAAQSLPHEMVLLDLYEALHALDTLTGATTTDDLLDIVFSTFCVGK